MQAFQQILWGEGRVYVHAILRHDCLMVRFFIMLLHLALHIVASCYTRAMSIESFDTNWGSRRLRVRVESGWQLPL